MATFEELKKANDTVKPTDIKGTPYIEVNQRIKAFRMVYPDGYIFTHIVSNTDGVCIFMAEVGTYEADGARRLLGTGTAYEREGSTFINKTSYIENAETSAVGRALGMAGFGIDVSVASAEEVQNAINNQEERKASPNQIKTLQGVYEGENLEKLLKANHIETLSDLPMTKASELIERLKKGGKA